MAVRESKQQELIDKRARASAIVLITRDPRFVVEEVKDDVGLDLVVRSTGKSKDGIRQFGVIVRGTWASVTQAEATAFVRPVFAKVQRDGPYPFPVFLFFFTMQESQGWYSVVAEPSVRAGRPHLRMLERPDCHPLNDAGIEEIIAQVDGWYDAYYAGLVTPRNGVSAKRKPRVS